MNGSTLTRRGFLTGFLASLPALRRPVRFHFPETIRFAPGVYVREIDTSPLLKPGEFMVQWAYDHWEPPKPLPKLEDDFTRDTNELRRLHLKYRKVRTCRPGYIEWV